MIFVDKTELIQMKRYFPILIFALIIALGSCTPVWNLPDEPVIEFKAFSVFDTIDLNGNHPLAGKLTFYFQDGDGDLGQAEPDTGSTISGSNLFFRLYRKTNGVFVQAAPTDPLYPSEYRIPYMEAPGQNPLLKGTIDVTMFYYHYNDTDTLYYDFRVRDRSGNESNTATTCVVVLGDTGTCSGG